MTSHKVNVHKKGSRYGHPGDLIETISRVLHAEQFGNFNPIFCTYKNEKHLVKSLAGDLSDPFRRNDTYADSLYIEIGP